MLQAVNVLKSVYNYLHANCAFVDSGGANHFLGGEESIEEPYDAELMAAELEEAEWTHSNSQPVFDILERHQLSFGFISLEAVGEPLESVLIFNSRVQTAREEDMLK